MRRRPVAQVSCSAKNGLGMDDVLRVVCDHIPPPADAMEEARARRARAAARRRGVQNHYRGRCAAALISNPVEGARRSRSSASSSTPTMTRTAVSSPTSA